MNESYAVLYQEFLMEPRTKEAADSIAAENVYPPAYFDDKKVRYVIVRHSQMGIRGDLYLCSGRSLPRIYTEELLFFFRMTSSADTVLL